MTDKGIKCELDITKVISKINYNLTNNNLLGNNRKEEQTSSLLFFNRI